jgi:mannose-1-phosphate guanylyltransferase
MKQYALLLAGGSGKRLWPFSREHIPKQFVKLPSGKTLLEATLERLAPLTCKKVILTTEPYAPKIHTIAQEYTAAYFVEPHLKNTAPAIAWACRELRNQTEDAVVAVLPTDHVIRQEAPFIQSLNYALNYAQQHDVMVLYGSPQTSVHTRFGFIRQGSCLESSPFSLHSIKTFHEKPSYETAAQYYTQPHIFWNMGIFVSKLSTLWQLYQQHAPHILENLDNYSALPAQSFDHAILEHAQDNLVMLTHDFGWSDIGTLEEFIPAVQLSQQKIEAGGAQNNTAITSKPVILAGVSNLVIVESHDMILITQQSLAQQSDAIAQQVLQLGRKDLL